MMSRTLIVSRSLLPIPSGSSLIVSNLLAKFSRDTAFVISEMREGKKHTWPDEGPNVFYLETQTRGRGGRFTKWLRFRRLYRKCYEEAVDFNPDYILAIFPDEFFVSLALKLSNDLGKPLFTWFHNTYLENRTGLFKMLAYRIQADIFDQSHALLTISDGLTEYLNQAYPRRHFKTIRHGFPKPAIADDIDIRKLDSEISFVYTGSFNASCADAALRLLRVIMRNPSYQMHLYVGGGEEALKASGITGDNVYYHDFIQIEDLYHQLSRYDIMLLPHGFYGQRADVEFQTIFPTRTIPYLFSHRPILLHAPSTCFLTKFFLEHDSAFIVDEPDEDLIEFRISEIVNKPERRMKVVKNALSCSRSFDIEVVYEKLMDCLES